MIIYTVTGGLRADVMTDLVQGIALILGLGVLLAGVLSGLGGMEAAAQSIDPQRLRLFGGGAVSTAHVLEAWMTPICGSVVAQELIGRVIACRAPHVARRSSLIAAGLYVAVGLIPVFLGLAGAGLVPGLEHGEQILPMLARQYLSPVLYVLFAGALISAILSTVDSCLLAASALVSNNVIIPLRPGMSEAAAVRTARGGVIAFGVVAYLLALRAEGVYHLVEEASSLGSAGLFVILVFGLFTRFGGRWSAIAALLAGLGAYLYASWFGHELAFLISLGSAFIGYLVVGLMERD